MNDEISAPPTKDSMGAVLRRLPGQVFAVIDGAHFDNLPARINKVGLKALPLFEDEIDLPSLAQGPHLVSCPNGYAIEQVRDVCSGAPAVVWWAWPKQDAAEDAIYSHLRRLNLVEIPSHRADAIVGTRRIGAVDRSSPTETVIFRHGDPHVMSLLLPILDPVQLAQVFGGALAMAMYATGMEQISLVPNPDPLAASGFGRLELSSSQYDELAGVYGRGLRRRAVYEFVHQMREPDVKERELRVLDAYDRAEAYGCASMTQIWEFIALDRRYGPRFEMQEGAERVLDALRLPDASPEERLWRAEMELDFIAGRGR